MTHLSAARTPVQVLVDGIYAIWENKAVRCIALALFAVALFMLCSDVFANNGTQTGTQVTATQEKLGLARYQETTLKPQAQALWVILKVGAIILGVLFMIIGFVRLTKQQKDGAWTYIIIGGALASVTTLVMLTGETIAGQKLEKDATDILGQTQK